MPGSYGKISLPPFLDDSKMLSLLPFVLRCCCRRRKDNSRPCGSVVLAAVELDLAETWKDGEAPLPSLYAIV